MARLPVPGSDSGAWGEILNEFLSVEHTGSGALKSTGTIAAKADDSQVVHLAGDETVDGIKTFSSSPVVPSPNSSNQVANKTYVDTTVAAGAPDATATTKGILRLTGDLSGTATTPTVPGLATKAGAGANTDITSLSGLTTPLSRAQGGTGNALGAGTSGEYILIASSTASARFMAAADHFCTGTNDGAVISTAIASLPASGGTLVFSEGQYNLNAASITLRSNIRLLGASNEGTVFKLVNGANGRLISSTASFSNITFEQIVFDANGTNQSDGAARDDRSMLFISNVTNLKLIRCVLQNTRHGAGLRMSGMTNVLISGCSFSNNGISGAAFPGDHSFCGDTDYYIVSESSFINSTDTGTAQDGVSYSTVVGNVYRGNVLGVSASSSTSRSSSYNTIAGNVIEGTGATADASGIKVSKFGSGVAANITQVSITGNVVRNCDRSLWVEQVDRIVINGNVLADAAGTNRQLALFATVGTINDVSFANNMLYSSTNRGISFSGGTCNNMTAADNQFISVTTPVGGTIPGSAVFRHNRGYATESSGSATVPSGSTSVTVTHSLNITPSINNISITPTNNLGSAAKFWVSSPTSSNFTINTDVDPGATTATFSWHVAS